jgi:hypothetical protein
VRAETELEDGRDLLGRFWLAENAEERSHVAPGVLRWSRGDGAALRLIGPLDGWPRQPGGNVTVQGETVTGDDVTLMDALVVSTALGGRATASIAGPTLLLGQRATVKTRWRRVVVRTANFHEWLPETGLGAPDDVFDKRGHTTRLTATWELPPTREIKLARGTLMISPAMATEVSYAPSWSIRTNLDASVTTRRRITLDDLHGGFVVPILSLLILASDRPDAITSEVVLDLSTDTRARVLRRGEPITPREWRPDRAYLFSGLDLPDLDYAIKRWFEIFDTTRPVLGTFSETINMGSVYSPERLVKVATCLESYATRWHRLNRRSLLERLEALQAYTRLPAKVTGSTTRNLKLLAASRHYFAHLNKPNYGFTPRVIEKNAFETTRRATALMQACLMLDLGFTPSVARTLLEEHYTNWPVPQ